MLHEHMPELMPVYDRIVALAGGTDAVARFLALYHPTPFLYGCSQAIWARSTKALLRNYDYPMHLCDGLVLYSAWTGTRVIAMADCLWGVLDGMNEHGLAVSLAFGGRKVIAPGFGITLILRYILELCQTTAEAAEVLRRIPVQMAYNVALLDRQGGHATVRVAPDREAEVSRLLFSANSQGKIDWPEHAAMSRTRLRENVLAANLSSPKQTLPGLTQSFLHPPLYRTPSRHDWGTLYTAAYYPDSGDIEYRWPEHVWRQSFAEFSEGSRTIHYDRQA